MEIVLATRNVGKFNEINHLLKIKGIEFIPVSNFNIDDIEETENSYVGNAILKASYVAKQTGLPAIADDSGLEIKALNGFPGIKSARCAGDSSDTHKVKYILKKMEGITDRRAEFVCCLVMVYPDNHIVGFEERCSGILINEIRGDIEEGIQYDSIFLIPRYNKTFGELPKIIKNLISARALACDKMKNYIRRLIWMKSLLNQELNGMNI